MKLSICLLLLVFTTAVHAQVWKVLPKGVRIIGYRNVSTSAITSNFNQSGQESSLGASLRVDGEALNKMMNYAIIPGETMDKAAYDNLLIGAYDVDAKAQMNVHGAGFGYGITDKVMFYGEIAHYTARVKANIKRTSGNSYDETADLLLKAGGTINTFLAENIRNMVDANESTIQSVITNQYKYQPVGDWHGSGYGDMETGFMINLIDRGTWGLMIYPGTVLPTGRQDDPDILQDIGFGDGQFDLFAELATGYVASDNLAFGTTLRYTYQAPTTKTLRIPEERDFQLSSTKGEFDVKYGDKINWMLNTTISLNDWISFTPAYRLLYQMPSKYTSKYSEANDHLAYNSDKVEHQGQITTTLSSITPFLKKEFMLPAQVNVNLVRTLGGKNTPNVSRFEVEFRMLF